MDAKEKQDKKEDTNNVFNLAEQPRTNIMPSSKKPRSLKRLLIYIVLLLIYSALLITATFYITRAIDELRTKSVLSAFHNPQSPLFLNLSGTFNGQIVEIKGSKAWVNMDKGGKVILSIQDPLLISELNDNKLKELGTGIDKIRLNENAMITVTGYGSGYIITSVIYNNGQLPILDISETASNSARQASPSAKINSR